MRNAVLKFPPPKGLVLLWWIVSHNLGIFLGKIDHAVYVAADSVVVLWLKARGKYSIDYHMQKLFAKSILPAGFAVNLVVGHTLTKLGIGGRGAGSTDIRAHFQPVQISKHTTHPLELQWVAFLRHYRTMEDVFDGLVWLKITTHRALEHAFGSEEYQRILPLTPDEFMFLLRPQYEKDFK